MDDYKRTLYMEARRRLSPPREVPNSPIFLRTALQEVLADEGMSWPKQKELGSLFSELFQLWDGFNYSSAGRIPKRLDSFTTVWWAVIDPVPRIAMIDFLLCREDNSRARRGY